jgi:hypothetical protein
VAAEKDPVASRSKTRVCGLFLNDYCGRSDIHYGPTTYGALGDTKRGKRIMPNITPEESFLIQAHALAECYVRIGNLEATKDHLILDNIDRFYGQTGKMIAAPKH